MQVPVEQVDTPREREASRFLTAYTLLSNRDVAGYGELFSPEQILELGRFEEHYTAAATGGTAFMPRFFAAASIPNARISTDRATALPVERVALSALHVPWIGGIAILQFEASVDLLGAIALVQQTCFHRFSLTIDDASLPEVLHELTPSSLRQSLGKIALDRDVHQLVCPGGRLRTELSLPDGDATAGESVYDEAKVMRLIYREDRAYRQEPDAVGAPTELNRPAGTVCRHARGVTVLSGWPEHVENGVALTAVGLLGAAARLRGLREQVAQTIGGGQPVAGVVDNRRSRRQSSERAILTFVSKQRAELAPVARELGELELYLTFGLSVPEVVLDSYRTSLAGSLGLAGGALEQFKAAIEARRAMLTAAHDQAADIRRRAWEWAAAYISLVAVALGLIFGFLGASVSQVSGKRSLFAWGHYLVYYAGITGVLLGAVVVYRFVARRTRSTIPAIFSEHRVDPEPGIE